MFSCNYSFKNTVMQKGKRCHATERRSNGVEAVITKSETQVFKEPTLLLDWPLLCNSSEVPPLSA